MQKTTPDSQPQTDVMPDLDDDVEPTIAADAVEPAADVQSDDDAPSNQPERKESPRDAIVRAYRERRAKEMGEAEDAPTADADAEDGEPDPPPAPVVAKQEPPAPEDEPEVELKVHGQTRKLKQSELIAKAQIALASENLLEEAKALVKEARTLRAPASTDQLDAPERDGDADDNRNRQDLARANQPAPEVDTAQLEAIVERIQVGDRDEGREALADLLKIAQTTGGMRPEEISRVVTEQIALADLKREIEGAAESFQGSHAAIVQDQELLENSLQRVRAELRADLAGLGYPADKLASLDGQQLVQMHQTARVRGAKLRDYKSMFDKVGNDMASKYGAIIKPAASTPSNSRQPTPPAPSTRLTERIERKRSATPQPRTVGVRIASEPQQKPKSKADIIAEMRRARGFKS